MAARYGGEEFCLPAAGHADLEGAVAGGRAPARQGVTGAGHCACAQSEVAAVVTASIGAVADTGQRARIDGLRPH
jgi:GGDEF domain-containing protein